MTDMIPTADPFADLRTEEVSIEGEVAQPYINSLLDLLHEYGTHTRKVLVSPGYGGAYSAWENVSVQRAMCEYEPLIEWIEARDGESEELHDGHPIIVEMRERLGLGYVGGLRDLCVVEVTGPYRITEYDGNESVETLSDLLKRF